MDGLPVTNGDIGSPAKRRRRLSLRAWVTLLVALPIATVSIALVAIHRMTGRRIAEQLGHEIVASETLRDATDVEHYLRGAMRVSDLYAARLRDKTLTMDDLAAWEQPLFHDLQANPDVASICYADLAGNCTWLLRAHHRVELGKVSGSDRAHAIEYPADIAGHVDRDHPIRIYPYDATSRPWFQLALQRGQAFWVPVYFWFGQAGGELETGTGYARAIRDSQGQPLGVLVVDVTLGALSEHLRQQTRQGYAFIVDDQGLLVAASQGAVNSPDGRRLRLGQSDSAAGRAVEPLMSVSNASVASQALQPLSIGGQAARALLAPLKPYPGIQWTIIAVLPESSFLAATYSLQNRSLLLALVAIVGGVTLGLLISRRLSQPLLALTEHVNRIGSGDLSTPLALAGAPELEHLSQKINHMSAGLRHRLALENSLAVARQVQQSLLPEKLPQIAGLQIVAFSRYAESTGGDYYDFIVQQTSGGTELLVAVGDVTGHGIGAALLMATARGAVRAACHRVCPLGELLAHTNRVLVSSSTRGMFMTLGLLAINRDTLSVRWATAGHDPAIVYYPETRTFKELSTDGIPLGIEAQTEYSEQISRCAGTGFMIVMGTDGIWEARNTGGEMFGKARLRKLMESHSDSAERLAAELQAALKAFLGDSSPQDDATIVVIKTT